MTDTPAPPAPAAASSIDWAGVAETLLHYVAAGALVGLIAFMFLQGKVDQTLFTETLGAAATFIGFKLTR